MPLTNNPITNITRWLLGAALLVASVHAVAATERNWRFKVFLDNKEIGTHEVTVVPDAGSKQVTVDADFDVKFLFFTAYRYQHRTEETWQGSCLKDIKVRTDDNGEQLFIRSLSIDDGFTVETHTGTKTLGSCVRSFAYWDPELLNANKLLNTHTGEYEPVEVTVIGESQLEISEHLVDSLHYRLVAGDKTVDLWYTPELDWLALKSTTDDGYQLSYYPESMVQ